MRCTRAQKMMAVGGDASPRRRRALERHLAGCAACRDDRAATIALHRALDALPAEAAVPDAVEQATLRRIRMLDETDAARGRAGWWRSWFALPAVALATAAIAVLAIGILRTTTPPTDDATPRIASARRTAERAPRPMRSAPSRVAPEPPVEPPPELAAAPDLFVDMPILRNMEKLQHFDAIRTTTVDDETPNG